MDAVVNLSGATIGRRWTPERKREILESRVFSTSLLARTLAELEPRPSALLCTGGVGIYGDRGDEVLTEESELGAVPGRRRDRVGGRRRGRARRRCPSRQLPSGHRPDGEGWRSERMLTPFKLGLGGRIGGGRQWLSWVSLGDLVAAYRFALEGDLAGPVNLTSPNPAPNAQFVKSLGRAVHRPTVFPLPALAVKALFGQMGEATLLEGQRAYPRACWMQGSRSPVPSSTTPSSTRSKRE